MKYISLLLVLLTFISVKAQEGNCGAPNTDVNKYADTTAWRTAMSAAGSTGLPLKQIPTVKQGSGTLVTFYYTVTASADGTLGVIMSVVHDCPSPSVFDDPSKTCLFPDGSSMTGSQLLACGGTIRASRDCKLFLPANACAGTVSIPYDTKLKNTNLSSTFNPEWTKLTPNATYTLVITMNLSNDCSVPSVSLSTYPPAPNNCSASAGTVSVSGGAMVSATEYNLTTNGSTITISSTGSVLPSPSTVTAGSTSTYGYFIFTQAPTLPFADVTPAGITSLPGFKGVVSGTTISDNNSSGISSSVAGATTLWFVPAVFDKKTGGLTLDDDADGCYAVGTPIKVNYTSCAASSGTISVSGGTMVSATEYNLTTNGSTITISSTGSVLPSPSTVTAGSTSTYGYFIFTQAPTLPFADVTPAGITSLPGFKGVVSGTTISDNNNTGASSSIAGATTLWFVPAVFDKKTGGLTLDDDADGCYAVGTPIKVNYSITPPPSTCSSCAAATCNVVVSTGATLALARSQSTTDMTAQTPTKKNVVNLVDDGIAKTICVPVTIPSDASTFGFKHGFNGANSTCATSDPDIVRSYTLVSATCSGPNISPKTTNGGGVGSGFNPEWDVVSTTPGAGQINPGNYVFCFTIKINPGSLCNSVPNLILGAYSNGTIPTPPPCPTEKTYISLDWKQSNPFSAWSAKSYNCSSPIDTIYKNLDINTISTGGQIQPFPGFKMDMSMIAGSDTKSSMLVSVNGVPYSYYGPTGTAPSGVLDWGPMATSKQEVMEPYIPKGATITLSICDTRATNQSFAYTIWDYATGNTLKTGTATPKSGACTTVTFTLTSPTMTWKIDGGTTGVIDLNNGSCSFDPKALAAGTHTLQYTFTNGAGCTVTGNLESFTTTGGPTITPTTPLAVCAGITSTTFTYTSTGSPTKYSIDWNAAANTTGFVDVVDAILSNSPQTITLPAGAASGTYTGSLTVKNASGCSSSAQNITVTINGNPTLTANPTSILVSASSAITVAGGSGTAASSNAWVSTSTANGTIVGAGQSATVTGVAAGNTNIIYTDSKGCDDTIQVTVTIPGCKTISNPSPAQILCQGSDPAPFTVSTSETAANGIYFVVYPSIFKPADAAAIYSGIGSKGAAISNKLTASAGTATIDLPPLGTVGSLPVIPGDYYVYAILDPVPSDVNCRPYAEIKVTINDSIIPVVITSTPVTSNATTFTWNDIPTASKFGIDTARLVSITPPSIWVPAGTVVNSTGGNGNTFTFNNIPLGQTAHIKITPQDISGAKLACSNSAMSSITNKNCVKPIPLALTAPIAVCEGASLNIIGNLDPNSVASSFKWRISSDGVNWSDVSGPDFDVTTLPSTISIPKTKFLMNNNFVKLVVTDKATGVCKDSTLPVKILVNESPNASISINPDPAMLCVGASQLISVTFLGNKGIAPYIFDYTLDGVARQDSSLVGSSVLTYDFTTNDIIVDSTFILTKVTDKNGCSKTISLNNSVSMQVIPVPTPIFTANQTIGCYPFKVIFTDKSMTLNKLVEWDFGDGSPVSKDLGYTSYTFKKAGDFTITFKSTLNGCSDTMMKTDYIHVKERPIAQFSPKVTNISMIDPEVQFVNSSSNNAVYYKWIFGDGSPVSNLVNPKHTFIGQGSNGLPDPGKYVVELYAYVNQDCWDSTSTTITIDDEQIYYIPNTFTPNGDEKNNTFQPIFTSGFDAQNYHFLIYNRWGVLVFESNNPAIGWDGTFGNKLLGNETFTWKLQFKEKMTEKEHYLTGHVNLIK